ncbi:MAG: cytochrome c3 family protein [Acidobacteria bacterium]|nr:cytochrome c3 family protein [Acidobacteriota bacterium]
MMGIPEVKVCMGCHQSVKKDSPHIEKLAGFAKQNRQVPWVRVYQIPSWVYFSHKAHGEAGAKCETCHGPVKERDVLFKETNINMGGCMECHEKNKASNDCAFCHMPK